MSAAVAAAIAFTFGLLAWKLGEHKKAVPWLMLIAGSGLAGTLGGLLDKIAGGATGATASAVRITAGVGITWILALGTAYVLYVQMKPKGKGPSKLTPWMALLFVPLLLAAGGVFADVGAMAQDAFGDLGNAGWAMLTDVTRSMGS